jgi:hypothetical protein
MGVCLYSCLVIWQANPIFSEQYYIVICGLFGNTILFHIISKNGRIFGEKRIVHEMHVLISSKIVA